MLATVRKSDEGYIARFERTLRHSPEEVWSYLTDNDKLDRWFSELSVDELREGGFIKFDMRDGTFEKFEILELSMNSVLEYTWGEDRVRFEIHKEQEGCRLILIEKIARITSHTPKDLAGWHVCLMVIEALLDGKAIDRDEEWPLWHERYIRLIESEASV
ncbi:SRPBCC family protein [Cohnella lupini]|uniref:Activator of Hsp90 ATPase-like protein n=1 Tax=Cohnella lupini TaxID=1294267 RepID=A0A3D9I308_9BACL|nr:SRPBCC family protein [Cohnella lupini]RED56030.1 activator of Hsp90 ATPase-like protein [Cohnella lupini]